MLRSLLITLVFLTTYIVPIESMPPLPSIGEVAPEIDLPSMDGENIKLSSLKGNLTLVNFWSTWCVACNTIKNPEYLRLYEKYKDYTFKGAEEFDLYSVAFDSNKSKWKKRIFDARLNWKNHVIDEDSYYSLYWWIYNIRSIPASFLLDEKGKILGVNMTYDQLDRALAKRKKAKKPTPPLVVEKEDKPPLVPEDDDAVVKKEEDKPKDVPNKPVITEKYVYKVQLGVFRKPNLGKFSKLKNLGTLETEKINNNLQRVLLGMFTRKEIYSILGKVKNKGYRDAFVVKRENKQQSKDTAKTDTPPKKEEETKKKDEKKTTTNILRKVYKVQLGVFRKVKLHKFDKIKHLGDLNVEKTASGLQRVLIGSFKDKSGAVSALKNIKNKGFEGFIVTRKEVETITNYAASQYGDTYRPPYEMPELMLMRNLQFPALKNSMLNKKAPEIILKNTVDAILPLSTQRGKVTLLHLWASWSGPARENHEELNKLYKKYTNEKFEIYDVAFDENKDRWKDVVKEDQLNWNIHVVDPTGMDSELLQQYGVDYLPAMFLIDEKGKVVAENLTYEQLEEELSKRLE